MYLMVWFVRVVSAHWKQPKQKHVSPSSSSSVKWGKDPHVSVCIFTASLINKKRWVDSTAPVPNTFGTARYGLCYLVVLVRTNPIPCCLVVGRKVRYRNSSRSRFQCMSSPWSYSARWWCYRVLTDWANGRNETFKYGDVPSCSRWWWNMFVIFGRFWWIWSILVKVTFLECWRPAQLEKCKTMLLRQVSKKVLRSGSNLHQTIPHIQWNSFVNKSLRLTFN